MKNLMKLFVMLFVVVAFASCSSTPTTEEAPVTEPTAVEAATPAAVEAATATDVAPAATTEEAAPAK